MIARGLLIGCLFGAGVFATARPAAAQLAPRVDVAGGYAYLQQLTTGTLPGATYEAGWLATAGVRFGHPRLSGVGEIGGSTRTASFGERQQLFSVLGGARFDLVRSSRLTLYAQGLAGMERFSEPGYSVWGLSVQPGAGVDIRLGSHAFARMQADYRFSSEDGDGFHAVRFFAGAGVAFGGR